MYRQWWRVPHQLAICNRPDSNADAYGLVCGHACYWWASASVLVSPYGPGHARHPISQLPIARSVPARLQEKLLFYSCQYMQSR
jgi:hypothetical protein